VSNYLQESPQGCTLDKTYTGELRQFDAPSLKAELIDFFYYSTPATLRVHINGKKFDMKFHTVDLWSLGVQQKKYPELVGKPSGEPKLLQGTLEIPEDVLDSRDPDIKGAVERYLRRFNLVPLAFKIAADDGRVIIESKHIKSTSNNYMDYTRRKRIKMDLTHDDHTGGGLSGTVRPAISEYVYILPVP
jgi:hypothetical protein